MYDYTLTFPEEVERYWGTRLTWGTTLFYLNRYSALFGTVPILAELLMTTNDPRKTGVRAFLNTWSRVFIPFRCVTPFKSITNISREHHVYPALYYLILSRLLSQILVASALCLVLVI